MARKKPGPDGPDYEPFIEDFSHQCEQWRASNETSDSFARRIVGLMRMEDKKWREQN